MFSYSYTNLNNMSAESGKFAQEEDSVEKMNIFQSQFTSWRLSSS